MYHFSDDATKKLYEMVNSPFTEDIFSHVRESFNHQHQVDAQMEWVTKKMNELDGKTCLFTTNTIFLPAGPTCLFKLLHTLLYLRNPPNIGIFQLFPS